MRERRPTDRALPHRDGALPRPTRPTDAGRSCSRRRRRAGAGGRPAGGSRPSPCGRGSTPSRPGRSGAAAAYTAGGRSRRYTRSRGWPARRG